MKEAEKINIALKNLDRFKPGGIMGLGIFAYCVTVIVILWVIKVLIECDTDHE